MYSIISLVKLTDIADAALSVAWCGPYFQLDCVTDLYFLSMSKFYIGLGFIGFSKTGDHIWEELPKSMGSGNMVCVDMSIQTFLGKSNDNGRNLIKNLRHSVSFLYDPLPIH